MRANIYIRKENEEAWEQLADKSMQVNHWLAVMKGSPSTKKPEKESITISTSQVEPTIDNPFSYKQVDKVDAIKGILTDAPTCKHGYDPELCKYAKPGKECK